MNRRDWMKMLAAGVPTALTHRGFAAVTARDALFIITDDPRRDVPVVTASHGFTPGRVHVSRRAITPSRQDITIVRNGQVIDPGRATGLHPQVLDLAADMRSRRTMGTHLVAIEPKGDVAQGEIVFECDGDVVERLSQSRSYDRISIPGTQGETVFSLSDRGLAVIHSSCRHELCIRSGPIRSGRIICAPNRLVATIGRSYGSLDAITG